MQMEINIFNSVIVFGGYYNNIKDIIRYSYYQNQ